METTDILDQKTSTLEVTENAKKFLKETSSWTKFISILSFIGVGLFLLIGLTILIVGGWIPEMDPYNYGYSSYFGPMIMRLVGLIYIVMGIIMFFPALFLYRFSKNASKALLNNDTPIMEKAFENMKSYWKFIGILWIIYLAIIVLCFLLFIIAGIAAL